jgi:hypothetical protein
MLRIRRPLWLLVLLSASAEVSAQIALDVWLNLAKTAEPEQPIVRGGSKFVLHRRDAGIKGPDGWYLASSTDGSYQVRFPAPMIDATVFVKGPEGLSFTQAFLTAQTEATRYASSCTKDTSFVVTQQLIESWSPMLKQDLSEFKSEPFAEGRMRGIQYSGISKDMTHVRGRIFLLDSHRMCFLMVGSADRSSEDAERSFASFRPH